VDEVDDDEWGEWTAFVETHIDFAAAAVLLGIAALLADAILGRFASPRARITALACLVLAFAIVWAELAVGVFGSVFAGD
jgi:hypothetical protein